jgi:hypothetical protein
LFCWQGLALTRVPKIKYLIIIGGARFRGAHTIAEKPYANKIKIPSLHFLGTLISSALNRPLQLLYWLLLD